MTPHTPKRHDSAAARDPHHPLILQQKASVWPLQGKRLPYRHLIGKDRRYQAVRKATHGQVKLPFQRTGCDGVRTSDPLAPGKPKRDVHNWPGINVNSGGRVKRRVFVSDVSQTISVTTPSNSIHCETVTGTVRHCRRKNEEAPSKTLAQ